MYKDTQLQLTANMCNITACNPSPSLPFAQAQGPPPGRCNDDP